MNVIAIIQARMNSTRLPGKTLMKINGKTIIEHVVERVRKAKGVDKVVVATSISPDDDQLAAYLKNKKIDFFRGSENDVLERYYLAAKKDKADLIIRVCGDQPLADPAAIERTLAATDDDSFTYSKHEQGWPDGTGCEIIPFRLLELAQRSCQNNFEREHIKPFFLNNSHTFKIKTVDAPVELQNPNLHLAIDTMDDFQRITIILENFQDQDFITIKEIIDYVRL